MYRNRAKVGTIIFDDYPIILNPNNPSIHPAGNVPIQPTTPIIFGNPINPIILHNNPVAILTNPTSSQCSCLTGQAYIDPQGNCGCHNSSDTNTTVTPTKYVDVNEKGQIIYVQVPTNPAPQNTFNLSQTLKDNPVLAIGGLLFIGFLVFKK